MRQVVRRLSVGELEEVVLLFARTTDWSCADRCVCVCMCMWVCVREKVSWCRHSRKELVLMPAI